MCFCISILFFSLKLLSGGEILCSKLGSVFYNFLEILMYCIFAVASFQKCQVEILSFQAWKLVNDLRKIIMHFCTSLFLKKISGKDPFDPSKYVYNGWPKLAYQVAFL